MAGRGGIDATRNAQICGSRGLVVVSEPGEVPVWLYTRCDSDSDSTHNAQICDTY